MTVLSTLYNLQYGVYNNTTNITLPNVGTYDCDISFPTNLVPSTTDASNIQYCTSANSMLPDSGVSGIVCHIDH